jgi:hypothetical protein
VLDRAAHADARGATHVLDRGVQVLAVAPLVVRCMCERGWPSYYSIVRKWKNVDVRGVQIFV